MAVLMGCPYVFCSQSVEAKWFRTDPNRTGAERLMIPVHDIRHRLLKGTCPASNLWLPLDDRAEEWLSSRAQIDGRRIEADLQNPPEPTERDREARRGGTFPIRPLYPRGPGQLPGRMGRQPEGGDGDWTPPRPPDEEPRLKPPHVEGHRVGGREMATVEQLMAQINDANVKAQEAIGALATAKEQMEAAVGLVNEAKNNFGNAMGQAIEARELVAQTMENAGSETLGAMLSALNGAIEDHMTPGAGQFGETEAQIHATNHHNDEATGLLGAAMEQGEQYIGRMAG